MAVIAFIIASGGSFGGYNLVKNFPTYGTDFETRPHTVRSVIDGDTIRIEKWIKVRLLGIDAPEKGECYFDESKAYLNELIDDTEIFLEKDISGTGSFGRLLRHIILKNPDPEADNVHINNTMVLEGYAFRKTLSPDIKYRDLFAASEEKARNAKRGMWGACDYLEEAEAERVMRQKDTPPTNKKCTIKGNVSEKGFGKIYSYEGCSNYSRVKIDPSRGDQYFCSGEEAEAAGFVLSKSCPV